MGTSINHRTAEFLVSQKALNGGDAATGIQQLCSAGVDLNYNDTAHVHAVTHIGATQKYWYDANGNQTTRIVGSDTFNLIYDAENRLVEVKKNSVTMATFVYDGDGRRVRSTVNGTTTYFIGAHYEVTGSTVTKYYYAGTQRVAVRTGSTLNYLLGDHLGSTSVVTNASGGLMMETRYKPWGEVRHATTNTTLPTRYTYTGQYSYINDEATDLGSAGFGLMFYNARWYDPYLGRFAQADTIIPQNQGVQAWDRYAFVNNNPLTYIDVSGHDAVPSDYWTEIAYSINLIADEYPANSAWGEVIGGGIGLFVGSYVGRGPIGGLVGVVIAGVLGHEIENAVTQTNADLKNFVDLMNRVSTDVEANEDGMITDAEYQLEITTHNVYNRDGELVATFEVRTFSVYVDGEWKSLTFTSDKAFKLMLEEFVKRGFTPPVKHKIVNDKRKETDW